MIRRSHKKVLKKMKQYVVESTDSRTYKQKKMANFQFFCVQNSLRRVPVRVPGSVFVLWRSFFVHLLLPSLSSLPSKRIQSTDLGSLDDLVVNCEHQKHFDIEGASQATQLRSFTPRDIRISPLFLIDDGRQQQNSAHLRHGATSFASIYRDGVQCATLFRR